MKTTNEELKLEIERLRAELNTCRQQLQQKTKEYEHASKALSEINRQPTRKPEGTSMEKLRGVLETAGSVCHDFNQPLMAVAGYCELMMMDIDDDHPLFSQLNKMREQVDRMGSISRKLVQIIRHDAPACL